jgi:phospholipid/cholesterol/gamma-HCH transport system substrate-binding protein
MPDASKVHWSQLKVGVVTIIAFLIVFVLVFLLTSTKGIFQHNVPLRTYMDDAAAMADGSVVRLNGINIGYLDKLSLTNSPDPKRAVEFTMMVREKFLQDIPVDSVVTIAAANLLGDKFINITKGQSSQHVKPGDELPSLQGQDIPELMAATGKLMSSFQNMVNRIDNLFVGVEAGRGNLGKFLKDEELYRRVNGIAAEAQQLLTTLRTGNGTASKLLNDDALYNELRAPFRRIDAILADLQAGQGTAGRLLKDPALANDLQALLGEMKTVVAGINSGKGTAGKLLKDEQLHQRLDALLVKMTGTLDRINSGQGTLGQLMVNPQLYESLNGATREFQSLAKDMRANPKKFLTIRLALF